MKSKEFFLELGNIEDDLIEEAASAGKNKENKVIFMRFVYAAAMVLLVCSLMLVNYKAEKINIINMDPPFTAKTDFEADKMLALSLDDYLEYIGMKALPVKLNDMVMSEPKTLFIYTDKNGETVYDKAVINYMPENSGKFLSVTIETGSEDISGERDSRLEGKKILLAYSERAGDYWAELELSGVSVSLISSGINETEFISIVREIIRSQR